MDTKGNPDRARWADLWYAALAVLIMCVGQGKAGWSVGLGRRLTVIDSCGFWSANNHYNRGAGKPVQWHD